MICLNSMAMPHLGIGRLSSAGYFIGRFCQQWDHRAETFKALVLSLPAFVADIDLGANHHKAVNAECVVKADVAYVTSTAFSIAPHQLTTRGEAAVTNRHHRSHLQVRRVSRFCPIGE